MLFSKSGNISKIIQMTVLWMVLSASACRRSPVLAGEDSTPQSGVSGSKSGDMSRPHSSRSTRSTFSSLRQGHVLKIHGRTHSVHPLVSRGVRVTLPPEEQMILKHMMEASYRWELDSFRSSMRRKVLLFIFFIIDASRKEQIPERYTGVVDYLRHTFMDLYLYKGAEPPEAPSFPYSQLEELVDYLYGKGFNLGVTSEKALRRILEDAHRVLWKGMDGTAPSMAEFREYMEAEVLSLLKNESRESLKNLVSVIMERGSGQSEKKHGITGLSRSLAIWIPAWAKKNDVLWVLVRDRRSLGEMDEIIATLRKRGYTGWDISFPYVLVDASGPCSMCIPRSVAPSYPSLPWNILLADWKYYTVSLVRELMGPAVASTLTSCGLDVLRRMVQSGIVSDGIQIHERVRRLILLQWYALQSGSRECRMAPTLMASYFAMLEPVTGSGKPGVFSRYLDILIHGKLSGTESQDSVERKLFVKSAPVDFSYPGRAYPFMHDPSKLSERLKWLLTVSSRWPLRRKVQIVSAKVRNASLDVLTGMIPRIRLYVPPRIGFSGGMIVLSGFRNLWDAMNWRVHKVATEYATRWK